MHYCVFTAGLPESNLNKQYHDLRYGFPVGNDNELFGRLLLEINQAGLSWNTILQKESKFRAAYSGFEIASIAAYTDEDKKRLLSDSGIIRNRLKIEAAIFNAGRVLEIQQKHGSFFNCLHLHQSADREAWTKLFRKTFRFTGGEIVNEFLMSTGLLPGAHLPDCPVYEKTRESGATHFRRPDPSDAGAGSVKKEPTAKI